MTSETPASDHGPVEKKYAVMGNPVSHSLSPTIHRLFARQFNLEISYEAIEVVRDGFTGAVSEFRAQGGRGLNVTLPFKEEAYRIATRRSRRADVAGAVNTLSFENAQGIFGDNTDGQGLRVDLESNLAVGISDCRILVIGAGGAVRGILGPLLEANPGALTLSNRTVSRAELLAGEFGYDGRIEVQALEGLEGRQFDLVINGTASSVQGEVPDLPNRIFSEQSLSYDLMYAKEPTAFMQWSLDQGANRAVDGLGMLVEQAAESFFIWHGVKPRTRAVLRSLITARTAREG